MDMLLGTDALQLGLQLENGDLKLATTAQQAVENAIKIALYTNNSWSGMSLVAKPFGSNFSQLLQQPVSETTRLALDKELKRVLSFVMDEGLASSVEASVVMIDNKRFDVRIVIDGQQLNGLASLGRA
jgi:phage baseplate assembly protein W